MPEAAQVRALPTVGEALATRHVGPAAGRHRPARQRCAPTGGRSAGAVGGPAHRAGRSDSSAHEQLARLERCIARRRNREPVSRILGEREFYGRSFAISPATLDPRPDSETLIEAALERVRREGWDAAPLRILDVGTGSGCLLLTLLCELPNAVGIGTDISDAALERGTRQCPPARRRAPRAMDGARRARRHWRAFRTAGLQSPLCALGRHRGPRSGGPRFRSVVGTRRRGRRSRCGSSTGCWDSQHCSKWLDRAGNGS